MEGRGGLWHSWRMRIQSVKLSAGTEAGKRRPSALPGGPPIEEEGSRDHEQGAQPHAERRGKRSAADHALPHDGHDVIDHKEKDGEHSGQSEPAFADDGPQRGTNEEQQDAGKREKQLAVPFDGMAVGECPFGVPFVDLVPGGLGGVPDHVLGGIEHPSLCGRTQSGKPILMKGSRIGREDGRGVQGSSIEAALREVPHRNGSLAAQAFDGIDGQGQLAEAHHFVGALEEGFIGLGEIEAAQVDAHLLTLECGHHVGIGAFALAHPGLESLFMAGTIPEVKVKEAPRPGGFHRAFRGAHHKTGSVPSSTMLVDQDVLQSAGFLVHLGRADGMALDAVVEHPILQVQGGLFAGHTIEQGPEFEVGYRPGVVGEEKGSAGHEHHGHKQWAEDAAESHAR